MIDTISTDRAPAAIGPYSQARRAGDFVFVSGQLPIDAKTGKMAPPEIGLQTRQSLSNVRAILEAAGMGMEDIVKVNVFLVDMEQFGGMNAAYSDYFSGDFPARAAVEVARLPKDALVEIEVVAHRA